MLGVIVKRLAFFSLLSLFKVDSPQGSANPRIRDESRILNISVKSNIRIRHSDSKSIFQHSNSGFGFEILSTFEFGIRIRYT